ncbi:hypothetical protein T484DRAFT_1756832 [Baffinella frigidus]|nr:hypothetical protein T484DRAFT_1756832 [Cryptophyta sp. CCMP2293]
MFEIGARWWGNANNFPGGVLPVGIGAVSAQKAAAPPPPPVDDKSDHESSCDEENPDAEPQPAPIPAEQAALLHSEMLSPHGQVWEVSETGPTVDVRAASSKHFRPRLRLKNQGLDIGDACALDFWWAMMPEELISVILWGTNVTRKKQPTHLQFAEFKLGEVLQMLGLLYGNCLSPTGDIFDMFNGEGRQDADDFFFKPHDIGARWKTSGKRLKPESEDFFGPDKWHKVRVLISSFNNHMEDVFVPGDQTGVIIFLEIQESAADMGKDFCITEGGVQGLKATTACTKRISSNWFGSDRVFFGDSWFSGVETAVEMLKTTVDVNGTPTVLWAIGYNEPGVKHNGSQMIKKHVTSYGTSVTKDGKPSTISKKRICVNEETGIVEDVVKIVPCPQQILDYYGGTAIGVHDAWAARTWWKRMFAWLLSVMEANAFRAYTKLGNHPSVSHREFTNMLSTQLMRNMFLGGAAGRRSQQKKRKAGGEEAGGSDEDEPLQHEIFRVHEHTQYSGDMAAQRTCNICKQRTKLFCASCTDQSTTIGGVFLCGPASGRQCIPIHIQRMMIRDHMM